MDILRSTSFLVRTFSLYICPQKPRTVDNGREGWLRLEGGSIAPIARDTQGTVTRGLCLLGSDDVCQQAF